MGQAGSSFFWPDRDPEAPGAGKTLERARQQFIRNVDASGFNWLVFIVAASGFFTDSYNLFASNVILPALTYVYWDGDDQKTTALYFNLATLLASATGQLAFGYFADRYGRKSLYGIELMIVITSTIGLLQCSNGVSTTEDGITQHTWNINGWIFFWRVVMGIGIGAEHPLSACIAAEWSSTEARGRMLAAVFLMQPLGQLCAYGAGLTAMQIFDGETPVDVDKQWRYVVGIGTLPTLLALGFRLFMPESGRYTYDVLRTAPHRNTEVNGTATQPVGSDSSTQVQNFDDEDEIADQISPAKVWHFLFRDGHWADLFGTSMCWALLDFAFYGLGFSSPTMLELLWSGAPTDDAKVSIEKLSENMTHGIWTFPIAAILGSISIIACIDWINRKHMLTFTFCMLALVLAAAAGSFNVLSTSTSDGLHYILVIFWNLISFLFSFGPNTLTFIIPAEVFPTKFRCTLYGIAAAFGKLGAVLVQIVILSMGTPLTVRSLLISFAACMILGALCSHFFVPEVQRRSLSDETRRGCLCGVRKVPLYVNIPLQELPRPPPPRWRRRRPAAIVDEELRDLPAST